ncbi:methyltransferase dimerization domain-containing protein [Desulfosarcina ovata]|uniref:O-methyltransferase dimerisation domain-containing protein n=1 Tax=Desulfosarcina ovata subsp. ovata TaxID=2752305 RepID=A0A5K8AIG4_9BACT|nr:methyltransferase dimerization domain-containing protein [Desulfosarcina ovata]BBO92485.1 hypothetical protein DSCOOX_56650 [Desulfosarcina ovata subsp. ovata]
MKPLPDLDLQLHALFDIINGRTKTQLLLTAIELNIFDFLSTSQSAESVAAELGTHPMGTRFLLDGLAALDLVDKEDGRYRNRPGTQMALHRQSPAYVGRMFSMMGSMAWMLSGQDLMFDSGEVAETMKRVGFSSVESSVVGTPMMLMELDIARK